MAELIIRSPDQPDIRVELTPALADKPHTVGRGEDCETFIPELKASRKHLRLRAVQLQRTGAIGFVAEELGSANGTWLGDQRISRRLLVDGDELRIGDTTLTFVDTPAPAAPPPPDDAAPAVVLGGSLKLATPQASTTAPEPEPAAPEPVAVRDIADAPPSNGGGGRRRQEGIPGALLFLAIAVIALIGVEVFLGAKAEKSGNDAIAQKEMMLLLQDLEKMSYDQFSDAVDDYAVRFPDSPNVDRFDPYLRYAKQRDDNRTLVDEEFNRLVSWSDKLPASEIRAGFQGLLARMPGDEAFAARVHRKLRALDERRELRDQEEIELVANLVEAALTAKDPARALRLLGSYRMANPGLTSKTLDRIDALQKRAETDLQIIFDNSWKAALMSKDKARSRELLAKLWPRVAGTPFGAQVAKKLREDDLPAIGDIDAPASSPSDPSAPDMDDPTPPGVTEDQLATAVRAESLLTGRNWVEGRRILAELVGAVEAGRLRAEWSRRLADVDRILSLVEVLGGKAASDRQPKRKLSFGRATVTAATPEGVTLLLKGDRTREMTWADAEPADVLALLKPTKPSRDQSMATAVLAADLRDREAFIEAVTPLYEKGKDLAAVHALVARRLYGRAETPQGGYRLHKGDLLDTQQYQRQLDIEQVAAWRTRGAELVTLVANKTPALKKLEKLKALRTELDNRRKYALLAIFNEKHYPYPYNKGSQAYNAVQNEIDRRVALVREVWDDPYRAKVTRTGQLEKRLDEFEDVLQKLKAKGEDVRSLEQKMAPYSMYIGEEAMTVREFYLDATEKKRFEYNRWVMNEYNPARTEFASGTERKQVEVTNEYRMMMGYLTNVTPGGAPYDSIDKTNVVEILDQGQHGRFRPLRAVRVDNRLTDAARAHSLDMSTRGFFSHHAPPNPATGAGPTSPFDRMKKAGYQGWGASENICSGATSPKGAHDRWCHSSGHHRNILGGWTDLGSGQSGRMWTQNFGMGGGARAQVEPTVEIGTPQGRGNRGGAAGR